MSLHLNEIEKGTFKEASESLKKDDYNFKSVEIFVSRADCPFPAAFDLWENKSEWKDSVLDAIVSRKDFKELPIEKVMDYAKEFGYRQPIMMALIGMISKKSPKKKLLEFAKDTDFEYEIEDRLEQVKY